MKAKLISMAMAMALAAAAAQAENAQGNWSGALSGMRVNVQFDKTADGAWAATLSVPAQQLTTRASGVLVTEERISITLPQFKASYAATWNAQEQAWSGTWRQGASMPLNLKRSAAEPLQPRRPQLDAIAARTPSYASHEVGFDNDSAKLRLAGTLTLPHGNGPFPAVVLVHGSGPIARDGDVFGHKPLLVLADYLSSRGIAVLRYDKRGTGKSSGDWMESTTLDLADDAHAALRYLRGRTDVDARRVGVVGMSEGGLIGPLLGARDPALAFVVMLAGPGVRGDRLLIEQMALLARAQGAPDAQVAAMGELHAALFPAMAAEPELDGARRQAGLILERAERSGALPAGAGQGMLQRFGRPWFHALLRHDPVPALRALRQPVLALNGQLDLQVPAATNLPAVRAALGANPDATVREMPSLNHLFQTARTGSTMEYADIAETIAPAALDAIGNWIDGVVRQR